MENKRLVELEIRYTQQQELLQELSDVLYQQGRVIDTLRVELDRLKLKLEPSRPGGRPPAGAPPHY
ncbi:SlyX family protein [Corallococcus sp. BB11-1]|uniref:SlyX family protein n=1 Tax=Corallococcus sp. BB11-1 TaxID=2996783 RepID=UPI002271DF9D|nr:SlyX family protein [Corallococcus sp. BB11-1]MCY1036028.1 SlyX family protein [Corallococcus sp. BB11-1]